ncbi:hypothetical protein [Streptomyces uncialis]|uniref:hypothetical protein n=1 Tax=Streptomyces uncialis TaxID=1048205 RepID=UPI0022514712|nr:hypothetical protein [Streptomyces uncialis]MCX4661483.1 hypothetical protein [Streptomyces uncialis]
MNTPHRLTRLHRTLLTGRPAAGGLLPRRRPNPTTDVLIALSPGMPVVPCTWAFPGSTHNPHDWEPQPGMSAYCPGRNTQTPITTDMPPCHRPDLDHAAHLIETYLASSGLTIAPTHTPPRPTRTRRALHTLRRALTTTTEALR